MKQEWDIRRQVGCWLPALVITTCLVTSPLWIGIALDAVPDRYLVAHAPTWLQAYAFEVEEVPLPTIEPTPWSTLVPIPTAGLDATASAFPAPTQAPTVEVQTATPTKPPLPDRVMLREAQLTPQGWNNCGESSAATQIDYWGKKQPLDASGRIDQWFISDAINPNREDRNTTADELIAFAKAEYGLQGMWRYDGDIELLQQFIAAGYMPIVETGYNPEPEAIGWTSHFLNVRGYDRIARVFYMYDSYNQIWAEVGFDELEKYWRQFNHRYVMFYPPEHQEKIAQLIGEEMNDQVMYEHALAQSNLEITANPQDGYAWFAQGTALVGLGRYEEAVTAYEQAQGLNLYNFEDGAWRMLWYQFGPYEAYYGVGDYSKIIDWANWVLANNEYSEEAYYWKGRAMTEQGETDQDQRKIEQAKNQFREALKQHPNWPPALEALAALE